MNVVSEDLNLGDLAGVLLQVGNELPGPDLPDANLSFMASRDNKLVVVTEGYGGDTILVSVVNLPQLLVVVDSEGPDSSIGPS